MRLLLADDHTLFRTGLRNLLEACGFEVVGEAGTGRESVRLARAIHPDIVLMDLAMPDLGGLDATRIISTELPAVKVVVLTASEDEADLFEAIKSGAQGYLLKNLEWDELPRLLEGVLRGEAVLTPHLARNLLREFTRPAPERQERSPYTLTGREREVLELLVQGVTSNREVARRLVVSENTVKYHLRNILDKLHLQNRAQIVAYVLRHGLLDRPMSNSSGPDPSTEP